MTPYYEHGGITIYHGDCREILPTLLVDQAYTEGLYCMKPRVFVTDPPYGLDFPYLSYIDSRSNLISLLSNVLPIMISGRAFILCGPTQIGLYPQPDWVSLVTWNTTGSFGKFGNNQWTPILCYGDDLSGFGSINGVLKSDVLRISGMAGISRRTELEKQHTCPKPLNLMELVVNRFTSEEETLLDPFMGSGTTLVAAKYHGRKAIGIEIEERYCELAVKRLGQEVMEFEPSQKLEL
jgi:hypothetical protein